MAIQEDPGASNAEYGSPSTSLEKETCLLSSLEGSLK
jgi:hypothetical protein